MYTYSAYYISQNDECQTSLKQFQMMVDEENLKQDFNSLFSLDFLLFVKNWKMVIGFD